MNSKLLKLDAPYSVIYAGGKVGRHVATLMVWNDDEDMEGGIINAASYPVIDEGEEFPAGTLCDSAELHDCRVLCPPEGTNLQWVTKIIEYDFKQLEPAGPEYILERMKLLGCKIVMPQVKNDKGELVQKYDFDVTLYFWKIDGPVGNDDEGIFRVTSNRFNGFYFETEGTPEEIYHDLSYLRTVYQTAFAKEYVSIKFHTSDGYLSSVISRLNEERD